MSTEFKLYNVDEKDLYVNQTLEDKMIIRKKMVEEAKIRGVKPTARKYNTYPSTVRRWIKKFENKKSTLF